MKIQSPLLLIILITLGFTACGELHEIDVVSKHYPGSTNETVTVVAPTFSNGDFELWDGVAHPRHWYRAVHSEGPTWDEVVYDEVPFSIFRKSTNAYSNFSALELAWSAQQFDDPVVYQPVDVDPGSNYIFSIYAKKIGGDPKMIGYIRWYDEDFGLISSSSTGSANSIDTTWEQIKISNQAPWNARYAYLMLKGIANNYDNGTSGKVVVDDARLLSSEGNILKTVMFNGKGGSSCILSVHSMRDIDIAVMTLNTNVTAPTYDQVVNNTYSGPVHHNSLSSLDAEQSYNIGISNIVDGNQYDVYLALTEDNGHQQLWKYSLVNYSIYTTDNYDFDGNIDDVLSNMYAQDTGSGNSISISTTITGIITVKDVYGSSSADKSYFVQDMNAGIFIFTGTDPGYGVGSKVAIPVSIGKIYYGMPEVTSSGSPVLISSGNKIYYQTGRYDNTNALGEFYRYDGSVAVTPDLDSNNLVGEFDTDDLFFHPNFDTDNDLTAGTSGSFYGAVNYSYSKYRLEITVDSQYELY